MLAERIRLEVFSAPFSWAGQPIRLSACFGIAASQGRSPIVVLREAAKLYSRERAGPETIQWAGDCPFAAGAVFLLAGEDDLLAW